MVKSKKRCTYDMASKVTLTQPWLVDHFIEDPLPAELLDVDYFGHHPSPYSEQALSGQVLSLPSDDPDFQMLHKSQIVWHESFSLTDFSEKTSCTFD